MSRRSRTAATTIALGAGAGVFALPLWLLVWVLLSAGETSQASQGPPEPHLRAHSPIVIVGNEAFTARNGVLRGSGTAEDPYVIEGWLIDAPQAPIGIHISDTDAYVIVRRCEVRNPQEAGIRLDRAANVTIEGCRVTGSERGFQIVDSRLVVLKGNVAEFNREGGFFVFGSQEVDLLGNAAFYNWEASSQRIRSWGIYIDETSGSRGRDNRSSGHARDVVVLAPAAGGATIDLFASPPPIPEQSCTQIFNEFFLFIGQLEGTEPLTEPYCALLLAVLRSLPDHMRGQIAQFILMPESEEAAGMYTGVGTVRLFANLRHLKAFTETTYHEIGHVLQDRLFTDQEQERWTRLHQRSGQDPDHYAIQDADAATRLSGILNYAMVNPFEDFASTFEAYTRDTPAMIARAQRIEALTGKTILREKIAFVVSLFRGLPYAYRKLLDWDSEIEEVKVRIQRASVVRLENGLPVTTDLEWEEF